VYNSCVLCVLPCVCVITKRAVVLTVCDPSGLAHFCGNKLGKLPLRIPPISDRNGLHDISCVRVRPLSKKVDFIPIESRIRSYIYIYVIGKHAHIVSYMRAHMHTSCTPCTHHTRIIRIHARIIAHMHSHMRAACAYHRASCTQYSPIIRIYVRICTHHMRIIAHHARIMHQRYATCTHRIYICTRHRVYLCMQHKVIVG
jgi:hypothetical protein